MAESKEKEKVENYAWACNYLDKLIAEHEAKQKKSTANKEDK